MQFGKFNDEILEEKWYFCLIYTLLEYKWQSYTITHKLNLEQYEFKA